MSVQIRDSFISDGDASSIIQGLVPHLVDSERFGMSETQFEKPLRTLKNVFDGKSVLEEDNPHQGGLLFTETVLRVAKEINTFYGVDVVPINPMMARISKGGANRNLHCDAVQLDGSPWDDGNTMLDDLEFSALVYLNSSGTDYAGGEIYFPNQELVLKPQTGQMIFFRGDIDHPHGVEEVTSGERYALVLFYGRSDRVKAYLQYKAGEPMSHHRRTSDATKN
jgi:hypothetical protein